MCEYIVTMDYAVFIFLKKRGREISCLHSSCFLKIKRQLKNHRSLSFSKNDVMNMWLDNKFILCRKKMEWIGMSS